MIDGAVIPYEVAPGLKVNELTKFTSEPDPSFNALYTTVFLMPMNKAKYESLPADLKAVIDKNSGLEYSAFMGRTQSGADVQQRKCSKRPRVTRSQRCQSLKCSSFKKQLKS